MHPYFTTSLVEDMVSSKQLVDSDKKIAAFRAHLSSLSELIDNATEDSVLPIRVSPPSQLPSPHQTHLAFLFSFLPFFYSPFLILRTDSANPLGRRYPERFEGYHEGHLVLASRD